MDTQFQDRTDAGRQLAEHLAEYADRENLLVLALPRGGVPVGYEVAKALHSPLDIFLVRKLGVPGQEELAMGAIATGGIRVLNEDIVSHLGIPDEVIEQVAAKEERELRRREANYRGDRRPPVIEGRTIILVDDGLATGASMKAAVEAVRQQDPEEIVVAVPVGQPSICEEMRSEVDDLVCVIMPAGFAGVGQWYWDFPQMDDEEVRALLDRAESATPVPR